MQKLESTLGQVISNITDYDEHLYLALSEQTSFNSEEVCYLVQPGLTIEEELSNEKYQITLGLFDIVDVIENLKQQISNPTSESILDAIKFYYNNDAFIEIES